ncbi:MAG: hypothetical protein ACEPO8_04135 [Rhodothermaceae bacterium]
MRFLITGLVLLMCVGCSTQKMFSLDPVQEDAEFSEGRKIAVCEDSLFASTINFEGQYGTHLVFFTYFENNSDTNVVINPGDFHFEFYKSSDQLNKKFHTINRKAYDPEFQIKAMNRALNESSDEKAALTFLNCLFGATTAAVAIANDEDDDDCDETLDVIDAVGFTVSNQIMIEEAYADKEAEILSQREFWKNEVLRKTTLYPGEKTGGLVHFPLHEETGWLRVVIPLGKNKHLYKFSQKLIQ